MKFYNTLFEIIVNFQPFDKSIVTCSVTHTYTSHKHSQLEEIKNTRLQILIESTLLLVVHIPL